MIYQADPSPSRGNLGLLRTAMSLWDYFRDGGGRDQEQQRKQMNEQAMQQNASQEARASALHPLNLQKANLDLDLLGQSLAQNKAQIAEQADKAGRRKASESVGMLPDDDFFSAEGLPQAVVPEFGLPQFSGKEVRENMQRTPWSEMSDAQKQMVAKVPGQFANLSPLDLANTWDMNVGVQTGGKRGIATTMTTRANGETSAQGEPVSLLASKSKALADSTFAKQVADHTGRLQDAFRKDRPFMVWRTADNSFRALTSQLSKQDPNGANDLAAAIGFARMLDPDSVVREGERDIVVKRSGGFFDVLKAYANQLTGNGMLSADQRKNLIQAAATEMDAYTQAANNALGTLRYQAASVGADPDAISDGPFVSPTEEFRKSGVLPAPVEQAPKFRSAEEVSAAVRSGSLTPGQKVLVEVPGRGWEEVTVGQDGNVAMTQTALPAPAKTLPDVSQDLSRMVMGGQGGNYPVPPRVSTLESQRPQLELLPFNIPLQYPQLRMEDLKPTPRHQLRPAR